MKKIYDAKKKIDSFRNPNAISSLNLTTSRQSTESVESGQVEHSIFTADSGSELSKGCEDTNAARHKDQEVPKYITGINFGVLTKHGYRNLIGIGIKFTHDSHDPKMQVTTSCPEGSKINVEKDGEVSVHLPTFWGRNKQSQSSTCTNEEDISGDQLQIQPQLS